MQALLLTPKKPKIRYSAVIFSVIFGVTAIAVGIQQQMPFTKAASLFFSLQLAALITALMVYSFLWINTYTFPIYQFTENTLLIYSRWRDKTTTIPHKLITKILFKTSEADTYYGLSYMVWIMNIQCKESKSYNIDLSEYYPSKDEIIQFLQEYLPEIRLEGDRDPTIV